QDCLAEEKARHALFESNVEAERLKTLYNAALLTAKQASHRRFSSDPSVERRFEAAAGTFDCLANTELPLEGIPNEISPDYLRILALCCLASAAEKALTARSVAGDSQWEPCAHLAAAVHHYYTQVTLLIKHARTDMGRAAGVANLPQLLDFAAVKLLVFRGLTHDYQALQHPDGRAAASRLKKALARYEAAAGAIAKQQLPGLRGSVEREVDRLAATARAKLKAAASQPPAAFSPGHDQLRSSCCPTPTMPGAKSPLAAPVRAPTPEAAEGADRGAAQRPAAPVVAVFVQPGTSGGTAQGVECADRRVPPGAGAGVAQPGASNATARSVETVDRGAEKLRATPAAEEAHEAQRGTADEAADGEETADPGANERRPVPPAVQPGTADEAAHGEEPVDRHSAGRHSPPGTSTHAGGETGVEAAADLVEHSAAQDTGHNVDGREGVSAGHNVTEQGTGHNVNEHEGVSTGHNVDEQCREGTEHAVDGREETSTCPHGGHRADGTCQEGADGNEARRTGDEQQDAVWHRERDTDDYETLTGSRRQEVEAGREETPGARKTQGAEQDEEEAAGYDAYGTWGRGEHERLGIDAFVDGDLADFERQATDARIGEDAGGRAATPDRNARSLTAPPPDPRASRPPVAPLADDEPGRPRVSRFDGLPKRPSFKPRVPPWVRLGRSRLAALAETPALGTDLPFAVRHSVFDDAAAAREDPGLPAESCCESDTDDEVEEAAEAAGNHPLALSALVPGEDLPNRPVNHRVGPDGEVLPAYHELTVLIRVRAVSPEGAAVSGAPANTTEGSSAPGVAVIFILDAWAHLAEAAKAKPTSNPLDLVALLLRVVPTGENDRLGLVGWVAGAPEVVHYGGGGAAGVEAMTKSIHELVPAMAQKRRKGTCVVVDGVRAAVARVLAENERRAGSSPPPSGYEIVVVSDGHDSFPAVRYASWAGLHGCAGAASDAAAALRKKVRVHSFGLGGACDHALLSALSKTSGGDYSRAPADEAGLSQLRAWLLRRVSSFRSRVATHCALAVACRPGVTLRHLARHSLVFDPEYEHDHSGDPAEGSLQLDDFSAGHESNVVATVGVAESSVFLDTTELAEVRLRYVDARSGGEVEATLVAKLELLATIVARGAVGWLPQVFLLETRGPVMAAGPYGKPQAVSSGDLTEPNEAIEVKSRGFARAITAHGTAFTLGERTSLLVNAMTPDYTSSFTLRKGTLFLATGQQTETTVLVKEPVFSIAVDAGSFVKIGVDSSSGSINVNCMHGRACITAQRNDEVAVVELLPLAQTQMTEKVGPMTPWTLEEPAYNEWLTGGRCPNDYLDAMLLVGTHVTRTVCAEWIGRSVGWLKKGGRTTESKGNRRCREFLTRFFLQESKHFLTNSMAGLAPATDHLRRAVDRAMHVAVSEDKAESCGAESLALLGQVAAALAAERAVGNADYYLTPYQARLQAECADAKAKEEKSRAEAELNRQRKLRDSEASRRDGVLRSLFPAADVHGVGLVYHGAVQQLIIPLQDIPFDPALSDLIATVTQRWAAVTEELERYRTHRAAVGRHETGLLPTHDSTGGLTLDEEHFVRLWQTLTAGADAPTFNLLTDQLRGIVDELSVLNEGTRRSRAVFSLFRKWDTSGAGFVAFGEVLGALSAVHGSDPYFSSCLDNLAKGVNVRPPDPIRKEGPTGGSVANRSTQRLGATANSQIPPSPTSSVADGTIVSRAAPAQRGGPPCWGTSEPADLSLVPADRKVTMRTLHFMLASFYDRFTERAYHAAVESVAKLVASRRKAHNTIVDVVRTINRGQQQDHLHQWDLRHVFDGITPKELAKLAKISATDPPPILHAVAAPICILSGLETPKKPAKALLRIQEEEDYWEVLKNKLMRDAEGFVEFLRHFPILSVTYRQVLRVMSYLGSPDFDSSRVLAFSSPLARLSDWLKLTLKIIFLEHDWDVSNQLNVFDESTAAVLGRVGRAAADATALHPDESTAPPSHAIEPAGNRKLFFSRSPNSQVIQKPHGTLRLNRAVQGIIEADDPTERACSRFSLYTPNPESDGILPDRKLNSRLLRTMPVASCTDPNRLPPYYVPRVDNGGADEVQSALQVRAKLRSRLGRSPGPPPGSPQKAAPMRPSSAPLIGTAPHRRRYPPMRTPSSMGYTPTPPTTPGTHCVADTNVISAPARSTEVTKWLEAHGLGELADTMLQQVLLPFYCMTSGETPPHPWDLARFLSANNLASCRLKKMYSGGQSEFLT
ncbi:hypothetical protein DIPPA_19496, partial [Diplonema papillatum]